GTAPPSRGVRRRTRAGRREPSRARDRLHGVAGDRDHAVELLLGDHQRRREEDALQARPGDEAALRHLLHEARTDLLVGIEHLLGGLVLDKLDGCEWSLSTSEFATFGVMA